MSSSDIKILLYMLQSLWAVIEMTAMLCGNVQFARTDSDRSLRSVP